jgi:Protein of unknown function (DUF3611)
VDACFKVSSIILPLGEFLYILFFRFVENIMTEPLNNSSTPVAAKKIASNLRFAGRFGLLGQLAPAVVSGMSLLIAIAWTAASRNPGGIGTDRNTGGGLVFTVLSLVLAFAGVFWFLRYSLSARKFADANTRPRKADTVKLIQIGAFINIVGLALAILGAQGLILSLFGKSLKQINPFVWNQVMSSGSTMANITIQPMEMLEVLANTQTIFAHFLGLLFSLWLLNGIAKQSA